ncbi:9941_t:CDS:2 [Acaulospora colombiana]|uniref:9941_t:CDS:1 n=1 Tax=Acaulospora colombiana TaxID=27376 RepID=A0ACA9N2D5_9GLOM|nr:9941_t:CDS:2 [Acaulospora colombiana]
MKGSLSNSGSGQNLNSEITAERDERIESLTNQMAELIDRDATVETRKGYSTFKDNVDDSAANVRSRIDVIDSSPITDATRGRLSPLSILPEFPFSQHMQPSTNYLRHRSPEPITSVGSSGNISRSSSMDTYKSASISPSNSHSTQSPSQYAHSSPHRATHPPPHMPMSSSQHRRSSQPTSLGFGSDSNLLNPDGNRYKENNSNPISQPQRPPSSSTSPSPTPYSKTENPTSANSVKSQSRPPPLPEPPDNGAEYKRQKRN